MVGRRCGSGEVIVSQGGKSAWSMSERQRNQFEKSKVTERGLCCSGS